eukprot:gene10165-8070_t
MRNSQQASSTVCFTRSHRMGNFRKFSQNEALKQLLLSTGDAELVEASPRDSIWGVGFAPNKAAANRSKWGLNLLGKALMTVREQLREGNTVSEQLRDTMAGAGLPRKISGNPRRNVGTGRPMAPGMSTTNRSLLDEPGAWPVLK